MIARGKQCLTEPQKAQQCRSIITTRVFLQCTIKVAVFTFCAGIFASAADQKWWDNSCRYRVPVQVKNIGDQTINETAVVLKYPLQILIKTGKVNSDATDIFLVDADGKDVQVSVSSLNGSIWFNVGMLPAKSRKIFYLYYGNPDRKTAVFVSDGPIKENPEKIVVTAGAEQTVPGFTPLQFPTNLDDWLKKHRPEEFDGRVWVRCRIDEPSDYHYNIVIDSEVNPYAPARFATGTISYYGLQPKTWQSNNDWGKPIAWIPPVDDTDWLRSGKYSSWVLLPASRAAQWFTTFIIFPKDLPDRTKKKEITLHLEFASQPSEDYIFHTVDEKADIGGINYNTGKYDVAGIVTVRMPSEGGMNGLKAVGTFTEYTRRRFEKVQEMKLSPAPRLTKLTVGTWMQLVVYRMGVAGEASYDRADMEFHILSDLGINCVSTGGITETIFGELAEKYGIINTTITGWSGMWPYTSEAYAKQYEYKDGETSAQRWTRVFDDYYSKMATRYAQSIPVTMRIGRHFNTGDEIGLAVSAEAIIKTPQLLDEFRQYLKKQGFTPKMLGAETGAWDKVFPETDRKPLDISGGKVEYARLFYHTKKFINDYSVMYYKAATDAVKKHFPSMTLIAPNFQAGPMQFAFIGNNNDMNLGALDLFELGRQRAFEGIMAEDWVYGWDAGIGRISLGADIMRAAARKHNLPMASYLVGGEAIRAKFFAYMMAGIKENQLYLYGPIGNIGPAWADSEKALAETADVTRKVKKMEDDIFAAKVRPAKVAQLIAFTSDIMQAKGLYFCPERQDLYVLLKHNYVPVDIVSEQDITEENILDNYSLLVISDPNIRQDVQKKIAAWVAKGGKLLAFVGAGNWDEYNQPCTILNPVLGVAKRTMVTQENWLQWSAAFYSTAVSKFAYKQVGSVKISPPFCAKDIEFAVWGAKLDCNPVTCKLLGRYEDGKPAVFINRYGKGEAVLAGVLVGQSYVRDHWPTNLKPEEYKFEDGEPEREFISAVLRHMGIKKYVDFSVPGIYTSVMDIPGGMLVFLNNASGRPISGGVLKIHDAPGTKTIDSIVQGPLKYHIEDGTAVLEMPLENVDIVRVISK